MAQRGQGARRPDRRALQRSRNEPMEDIVQVGTIGLIKAIDRFDCERGV
ncbi:sigma factor, partial [Streptomyces chrestomyceticus]